MDEIQDANVIMLLNYQITYWRNKARRAEQQLENERKARKLVEEKLEQFNNIPLDLIDTVLNTIHENKLTNLMKEVSDCISVIGILEWNSLSSKAEKMSIHDKIIYWTHINNLYKAGKLVSPEQEDE